MILRLNDITYSRVSFSFFDNPPCLGQWYSVAYQRYTLQQAKSYHVKVANAHKINDASKVPFRTKVINGEVCVSGWRHLCCLPHTLPVQLHIL